jgi:hypothetical protein
MSQTRVDRIELTTFAEVGEFLGQEWEVFDRQRWGEAVDWEKKRTLLRSSWLILAPHRLRFRGVWLSSQQSVL